MIAFSCASCTSLKHIFSPPSHYWSRGAAGQRQQGCGPWRVTRAAGGSGEGRRCAGGRSWACSWWRACRCQQSARDGARSKWGCGGSWRDSRTACWRRPLSPSCQDTLTPSWLVLKGDQKSSALLRQPSPLPHGFPLSDPLLDNSLRCRITLNLLVWKCDRVSIKMLRKEAKKRHFDMFFPLEPASAR